MSSTRTSLTELTLLLISLFTERELRFFLGSLPGFAGLLVDLPGHHATLRDLFEDASNLLDRHGFIAPSLFIALVAQRPRRFSDIQSVARRFKVELSESSEIAALLATMQDKSAEALIRQLADARAATTSSARDAILKLAELSLWHRLPDHPDPGERQAITTRLLMAADELVHVSNARSGPVKTTASITASLTPLRYQQMQSMRREIRDFVQDANGTGASKRLLDLAKHFGAEHLDDAIELDLSLRGSSLPTAQTEARQQWIGRLRQILRLADMIAEQYRPVETPPDRESARQEAATLVTLVGIHKRHRNASAFELRGVDLVIERGAIVGVIGPNGAGKSTLLRILVGELAPDRGYIRYPGLKGGRIGSWQLIRQRISYVPQRPPRWHGSLDESLYFWAARCGLRGQECIAEADYYIQRLGLAEYRHAHWEQTSGGFQMRYELARAMLGRPDLLVLDEPLAFLDIRSQEQFLQDLRSIARSYERTPAIVLSSQHIHEVESLSDVLLYLDPSGSATLCRSQQRTTGRAEGPRMFELRGTIPPACIDAVTTFFGVGRVRFQGETLLLDAPPGTYLGSVTQRFTEAGADLRYVRDITDSAISLFREANG